MRPTRAGRVGTVLVPASLAGGLVALVAAVPTPAIAQGAKPPPAFTEVIEVRVVEVEVVVTDAEGERVHGLERDDFRLLVSGREVPIEYFDERRGGETVASAPGSSPGVGSAPSIPADGCSPTPR